MAMLGKRFQRTISMSQIGPGTNVVHAEKAQAHHHYHPQQQEKAELAEHQPADQWEILKNAEAMMMMMMANTTPKSSEEGVLVQERPAANKNEQQHPQIGLYACSPTPGTMSAAEHHMSSPSTLIIPTQHFLDSCFYCKRRLRPERDIFIYRGDAAFCTEECRHRQILSDETRSARAAKKGGSATSETAVAA